MGFQMKEILEKIEVGLDPQESFTKMNKDQDVKNGIRGRVMHLNPPMVKKTPKEVGNRKTKTTKNMGMKNNGFIHPFVSKRLSLGSPPMDLLSGLKKMLLYKTEQVGIGTLTRLPFMGICIITSAFACLPPSRRSLGSHGSDEKMILSYLMLGG